MNIVRKAASIFLCFACLQVHGQAARPDLKMLAEIADDIALPSKVDALSFFSRPKLAVYKPAGQGPFPALVIVHQCGGLRSSTSPWQNQSILAWARTAVERGYVALVADSLGPRGIDSVCERSRGGLNWARGVKDAFQAAAHLRTFDFVDPQRLYLIGFSWGASIGLLASNKQWAEALSDAGARFAAVASFYPRCHGGATLADSFVGHDIDRPLLVLAGELDAETPAAECIKRLEAAKSQGAPVQWHVYPQVTHCWDCKNLDGYTKVVEGRTVSYSYSSEATKDSAERVFSFFAAVAPR